MTPLKTRGLKSALDLLYYSRAFRLLEPAWAGAGIIFTLHHVREEIDRRAFAPNRILEVSRAFLEAVIRHTQERGYDIVSLDELHRRLMEKDFGRRMACFTLDDGYRDNYAVAYPVFKRYGVPFCVYVTSGLLAHEPLLWWRALERVVEKADRVSVELGGKLHRFATDTSRRKYRAYGNIYWALRAMSPHACARTVAGLAKDHGVDARALSEEGALTWAMLSEMSRSGLLTVGAHTVNHHPLMRLSEAELDYELRRGREELEARVGLPVEHFAYPYGDASSAGQREFHAAESIGFKTATTTRKGLVYPEHAGHLHALPRVSLNGDYQRARYVTTFMSGAPFALHRRFRRLDVH